MSPQKDSQDDGISNAVLALWTSGAGSAAALAALGAGAVGTLAGAVAPAAIALIVKLGQRLAEQRRLREGRLVELAATSMGGLDILEDRLDDPERLELYSRVIKASGRSTFGAKIEALAQLLYDGLKDGGSVQEAMALVAVIDDLEAPHVLLLHYLKTSPVPPEEFHHDDDPNPRGWEIVHLERASPDASRVVGAVVAVLVRHGLIRDVGGVNRLGSIGPAVYQLAPLGERCLLLLGVADAGGES